MDPPAVPLLIAFGANLDPLANLAKGLGLLHQRIGLQAISTVYRTPPLGDIRQPDFFNGAVRSERAMPPLALKHLLREIEAHCGRTRDGHPYGPRTLDLDVAMMGEMVFRHHFLTLPDPDIPSRPFLLHPLAELAPDLVHPLLAAPLANLAHALSREHLREDPIATRQLRQLLL